MLRVLMVLVLLVAGSAFGQVNKSNAPPGWFPDLVERECDTLILDVSAGAEEGWERIRYSYHENGAGYVHVMFGFHRGIEVGDKPLMWSRDAEACLRSTQYECVDAGRMPTYVDWWIWQPPHDDFERIEICPEDEQPIETEASPSNYNECDDELAIALNEPGQAMVRWTYCDEGPDCIWDAEWITPFDAPLFWHVESAVCLTGQTRHGMECMGIDGRLPTQVQMCFEQADGTLQCRTVYRCFDGHPPLGEYILQ